MIHSQLHQSQFHPLRVKNIILLMDHCLILFGNDPLIFIKTPHLNYSIYHLKAFMTLP